MGKNKNAVEHVATDLQIDEHIEAQESGWKVQVIGLLLIFALVAAAAIGLFGNGLMSKKKVSINQVEIEYERFYRFESRMPLRIQVENEHGGLTVSFPNSYLENFQIESILPEPNSSRFEGDKVQYAFDGKDRMEVTFYLIPRKMGNVQGSIEVKQRQFPIDHFIFP